MSEEFKAILDLLQATGDASANLFIFYVAMDFLKMVLGLGGFFTLIYYIAKSLISDNADSKRLEALRDLMGIGVPGPVTRGEMHRMVTWVLERVK